jgi:hypothetical protein
MHAGNTALEISALLVDRGCEQEIPDGVPPWRAWLRGEAKAQEIGRSGLCVREGNETVPQVAHGRDSELLAQHPRRAAVIAHGDDRGEMCGLKLQSTKRSAEPRTAAKHHHASPTRQPAATLEQFEERYPRSICAVRQDRCTCQPNEASPYKEEAEGGRSDGPYHRIKVAQGGRFSNLYEWIRELCPRRECTDSAQGTERNDPSTQERQQ